MYFIFFILCSSAVAFDFAEEVAKYVDHDIDPCDNFYRHACPKKSPVDLSTTILEEQLNAMLQLSSINVKQSDDVISTPAIWEDIMTIPRASDISSIILSMYMENCESGKNTSGILNLVEKHLQYTDDKCYDLLCISHLSNDKDCNRVRDHLENVLSQVKINSLNIMITQIIHNTNNMMQKTQLMNSILTQEKRAEFTSMFKEIKEEAKKLIGTTPWSNRNNVSQQIEMVVDKIYLKSITDDVAEFFKNGMLKLDTNYGECRKQVAGWTHDEPKIKSLCVWASVDRSFKDPEDGVLFNFTRYVETFVNGGETIYPQIDIGYLYNFAMATTKNNISKFGLPGLTLAHELAHSIVKSHKGDIISYFSNEAKNCIQTQFRSTCNVFDEGTCSPNRNKFFEEDGADVLGLQIVINLAQRFLLENDDKNEVNDNSVELQKLFYGVAASFCSGPAQLPNPVDTHSPHNIRVNAMVNHPAFQAAFGCSNDSKMMKSKTAECSVYGMSAPLNRRRFTTN